VAVGLRALPSVPQCNSDTGCFSIQVIGDAKMVPAKVRSGMSYGVDTNYSMGGKRLTASIWDSDGDAYVNVTAPEGHCVFDIGSTFGPYLQVTEMSGLRCRFALERTFDGPSFAYVVETQAAEEKFACRSGSCAQPVQPQRGSGCGERCDEVCARSFKTAEVPLRSCLAGCRFRFPSRTHQDAVDEYCSTLMGTVDFQACAHSVAGLRQCMAGNLTQASRQDVVFV
jgi:hypothetical protein